VIFNVGGGVTDKYFSGELQVGARVHNSTITAGYTSLQLASDQPVLFNIRAGQVLYNRVHVYAGYVRVQYSFDDKQRNYDSWQAGAQYLFPPFKHGCFYIGAGYTGNGMVSAHVGLAYNLRRGEE
jgi:hypothetical protein